MTALIVLICIVLVIVLAVSFVPVRCTGTLLMQGTIQTERETEADIRWGIISFHHTGEEGEIRLINRRIFTVKPGAGDDEDVTETVGKKEEVSPQAKEDLEEESQKLTVKKGKQILQIWPVIWPEIKALLRIITFDRFTCRLRLGFDDAALTGEAYGYFQALRGILTPEQRVQMYMEPVFHDEAFRLRAVLGFSIRHPVLLFPPVIRLVMNREIRALIKEAKEKEGKVSGG